MIDQIGTKYLCGRLRLTNPAPGGRCLKKFSSVSGFPPQFSLFLIRRRGVRRSESVSLCGAWAWAVADTQKVELDDEEEAACVERRSQILWSTTGADRGLDRGGGSVRP